MGKKKLLNFIDIQMAIAVGISLVLAHYISFLQIITLSITILFVTQEKTELSLKSGITRIIITTIGGLFAIGVVLIDNYINSDMLFYIMVVVGILLTIATCKLLKLPYFASRIGAVTFVLVAAVGDGNDRIEYAFFRLLSTFVGILIVMVMGYFTKYVIRPKGIDSVEDDE